MDGPKVSEEELEGAQRVLRIVLAHLPGSGFGLLDRELRVRLAEGPAMRERGITTEAVRGRPLPELLSRSAWRQIRTGGAAVAEGEAATFEVESFDGRLYHVQAVPVVGEDGAISGTMVVFWDVTEHAQTTDELRRRLAQQSVVRELGEQALAGAGLDELMAAAARAVAHTLAVDHAALVELDPATRELVVRAGVGWRPGCVGARLDPGAIALAGGLEGLREGPVVADDLRGTPSYDASALAVHGVVSGVTVLVGDGEQGTPYGLLAAHCNDVRAFSQDDVNFLQAVSHVVASAIGRTRVEERARHDALHDALTGLPNRTLMLDRLALAVERARRTGRPLAVLFLDVDHFKVVNDSLGHAAGDDLLRQIAPRLTRTVRAADTVARFGGDEFVVLCEELHDEGEADRMAGRIADAFGEPFVLDGDPHVVSTSVGLVVSRGETGDPQDLVRDADAAMYRAKASGRGRVARFDEATRREAVGRLRIEAELRRALREDQLRVVYQPFFALPERRMVGVEALVRWDHPARGVIGPDEFLPVAEASGLIADVGDWVLAHAAAGLVACRRAHPAAAALRLTVNVAGQQLARPELAGTIAAVLAETGLDPAALGLEITEHSLIGSGTADHVLAALKSLGVTIVLDDFGTGYSSLSYLRRFPIDVLKIDRAFVADLTGDTGAGAILGAILAMAGSLGLEVVPEGVETERQLAELEALGCGLAQGFLLGRPTDASGLRAYLPGPGA
jgi:diguanylate cyclase (GGDEF)-like protein